jgi:hypothetical protein
VAITRKLLDIAVTLDSLGAVKVESSELVTDDVDGTTAGRRKNWHAPAVKEAAEALRDAVLAQAIQQGKPMQF